MKRCPKCNQEFTEEWLTFCTSDGTPLTEAPPSKDYPPPPPTMTMPRPVATASQEERPTMRMPPEGVYGGPLAVPQQSQSPVAPDWQPPPAPFAMAPQPQQSFAVASLVLGLVSMTVGMCCSLGLLTAPVAIGLGIYALVQIKNHPSLYTGKPLAIIGIVTGSLYLVISVLLVLFYGLAFLLQGLG